VYHCTARYLGSLALAVRDSSVSSGHEMQHGRGGNDHPLDVHPRLRRANSSVGLGGSAGYVWQAEGMRKRHPRVGLERFDWA
jgi:hypothetical protein